MLVADLPMLIGDLPTLFISALFLCYMFETAIPVIYVYSAIPVIYVCKRYSCAICL